MRWACAWSRRSSLRGWPGSPTAPAAYQPDRRWVDNWLHHSYLNFWATRH